MSSKVRDEWSRKRWNQTGKSHRRKNPLLVIISRRCYVYHGEWKSKWHFYFGNKLWKNRMLVCVLIQKCDALVHASYSGIQILAKPAFFFSPCCFVWLTWRSHFKAPVNKPSKNWINPTLHVSAYIPTLTSTHTHIKYYIHQSETTTMTCFPAQHELKLNFPSDLIVRNYYYWSEMKFLMRYAID